MGFHNINDGYVIPYGRWFQYVSCPHYTAEIIIYLSFAIVIYFIDDNNPHGGIRGARKLVEDARCHDKIMNYISYSSCFSMMNTNGEMLQWLSFLFNNNEGHDGMMILMEEIILWILKYRQWVMVLWVFTNLSISAKNTHCWYKMKFGLKYPQGRRALVPFVW